MNTKLQIFISSTYTDLIEERQAAVQAILRSGHIPAGMELFTSGDKSQWEIIQRWISESDIYFLILGGRYGSIEPNSGISYTELEYDFAISLGKPYFAVVISNDYLEEKVKSSGTSVIERENPQKLDEFRKKVLSKISSFYSDAKDVKLSVLESIPRLQSEYSLEGWVRKEDTQDSVALAREVSNLHSENAKLKEKINNQEKTLLKEKSSSKENEEFEELFELLKEQKLNIKGIKSQIDNSASIPDEVSVVDLSLTFRDLIMRGATNQIDIGAFENFVFFRLCPILQTHELVSNDRVPGVRYRRYAVTKRGVRFFAYIDKLKHKSNKAAKASKMASKVVTKKAAKKIAKKSPKKN